MMKPVLALGVCLVSCGQALSQDIEPMRSLFEARAVRFSAPGLSCSESSGGSCDLDGSGVILGSVGDTALVATAAHVVDPLYGAGSPNLAELTLDWPNRPASCSGTLRPRAIWRREVIEAPADDIAFVAVGIQCEASLEMVTNGWQNGTPSYGKPLFFVDLYSPFGARHLSSLFLSDSCIRAGNCYDGGLVRIQGRIMAGRSGSAVFSMSGLVGLTIETGTLIAAPRINTALEACASGRCQSDGDDIPLAPLAELFAATLEPPGSYAEEGLSEDLDFVSAFMDGLPPERQDQAGQNCCGTDERVTRVRIGFADGIVLVYQDTRIARSDCTQLPDLSGQEQMVCSAPIDQLDPTPELWSGPSMRVTCSARDCFSCDRSYEATLDGSPDIVDRKTFEIDYAHFPVSDMSYFYTEALSPNPERIAELEKFGRAFARILSGGNDRAFCARNFLDC